MPSSYQHDPRWITARYPSTCVKDDSPIRKGDLAWFYPAKYGRKGRIYCEQCGGPMAREFDMAVADEDFMNGQFRT